MQTATSQDKTQPCLQRKIVQDAKAGGSSPLARPRVLKTKKDSTGIMSLVKDMAETGRYLLILGCSKRKRRLPSTPIPAIERYDGPFYRIIRKAFREHGELHNLDVMVLSAKYGLIDLNEKIATYDQHMTLEMAKGIAGNLYSSLANILKTNQYEEVMINLGKEYMMALNKSGDILENQKVRYGSGGIGERMKQLKEWLSDIYREG